MAIPKRPQVTEDMVRQAAREILPRQDLSDKSKEDKLISDIVLCYEHPTNGYELARELDVHCGWGGTQSTVEELGEIDSLVEESLEKDIAAWVEQHYPEPPLPNGTVIQEGIIKGVYEHNSGYFKVQEAGYLDPNRSLLIRFEDAVRADPADIVA